ncbi:response regulator [Flavobacterium aestuarii]|uniref:response regulator n=1 Tax=Flavobacterium aestuarii TaxID=3149227 RepID=UPI0032B5CAAD
MCKILLIEDNEGDIFLIKEALNESNFHGDIVEIKDGEAAISFFLDEKSSKQISSVNLILLDVNLPKKNGHEVLKFIKSNDDLKHIPVVMLTTSSSENDIKKAYKNHVNSYITKPSDTEEYYDVITNIKNYWFFITQLSN